jgi:ABC-type spermidine/putrescine transport system permease subunit I
LLLFFFVIPILRMATISLGIPDATSIDAYVRFVTQPPYVKLLLNTLKLAALVTVATLLLSYPLAYVMTTVSGRMFGIILILVLTPFWTSLLARTFAWLIILGRYGVINQTLLDLGIINQPLELVHNLLGATIGSVQILLPYMLLPIFASMRKIDPALMTASQSLGAGPVRTFFRVFLPLTLPGVMAGCLMVFIITTGFFIVPALMGGPTDGVIAPFIYQTASSLLDTQMASAMAFVLLIVVMAVYLPFGRWLRLESLFGQ